MQVEPPDLTPYQLAIINSKARYTITTAATKVGKTFSHLWWLFLEATKATKAGSNYWWVAPVYSQAKIAFNRIRRISEQCGHRINESELFIEFNTEKANNVRIWFKSAEKSDALYGEDVFAAVMDEYTRCREESWVALRSTLTATRGPCKFIGNAKGRKNWGYRLSTRAKNGEQGYEYFKITAFDAVDAGILELDEVEQARIDLPDFAFRELYLAEELEDQANPFGISAISARVRPISNMEPVCFGVDLAKSVDWTVITGLDGNGDVCFFDRFQADWTQTTERVINSIGYKPANIDSTGVGDPIFEVISKKCAGAVSFKFTQHSKQQLMEGLASAIQKGEISVLNNGPMREELENFEFQYSRSGVRYSAPEGMHDDCVMSLALANELKTFRKTSPTLAYWAPKKEKQKPVIKFT